MPTPDLVLFTAAFPYDGSESVLRSELEVIATRFRRLFLVPSRGGTTIAKLPANATVVDLGWGNGWSRATKRRILQTRIATVVVAQTLAHRRNWRSYAGAPREYLDILATNLLKARSLRSWLVEERLQDALFYDYWFENTTLAIATLRSAGAIRCAVSRAHRFDIFDSAWGDLGRVPFREFKAQNLDAVFAISEDGATYLRSRFGPDASKVTLSRLGVPLPSSFPTGSPDPPLIVSCSALLPRKHVHLIPAVLAACDQPVRWIHFGDGPERQRVETAAAALPNRVQWELTGWVDNSVVRDFYRAHRVSAFLSVSTSEGIPVSMMEAQSFGVPIVGLAVGGIPELVTPKTGRLVQPHDSSDVVAQALRDVLSDPRLGADEIRAAFAERYDANAVYQTFADSLMSIWSHADGRR